MAFSAFAGNDFTFELLNFDPFFKDSSFDPYGMNTSIGILYFPKAEDAALPIRVAVKDNNGVYYADFETGENVSSKMYVKSKLAQSVGVLHASYDNPSFPKIEAEIILGGYVNSMFNLIDANQFQGFDGAYLYGLEMRVAEKLSLRFGLHHLSGHFGDEVLEEHKAKNGYARTDAGVQTIMDGDKEVTYYDPIQYVRHNEWLASISYDAPNGFTPYAQLAFAKKKSWIRPFFHNPIGQFYPTSRLAYGGECIAQSTGIAESEDALKDKGFRDFRVNAGLNWEKSFGKFGVYAGFDVQAYQDEQTKQQTNSYSKDNPWGFDFTAGVGFEIFNAIGNRSVAIEVLDHYGRIPLLNFFYEKANTLFVGVRIK